MDTTIFIGNEDVGYAGSPLPGGKPAEGPVDGVETKTDSTMPEGWKHLKILPCREKDGSVTDSV